MDVGLKRELEQKVTAGERLTREDGIALYESDDLAWLGRLAHQARTRKNGDAVHFTAARRLDLAGVPVEDAVRLAEELADATAAEGGKLTELHLLNAVRTDAPWGHHPDLLRALKVALPDVTLKAFTAAEIQELERISGKDASDVLDELMGAGPELMTGGDAGIFDEEIRQGIAGHGISWENWSRIHRLAHEKGLKTSCTMFYGHDEEHTHRVDHVLRLRELQDETGGFEVFAPLRHQPDPAGTTDGATDGTRTTAVSGAEALKTFAVSRLLLDNVAHIKACYATHGLLTTQLALQHGADDIDVSGVEDAVPHEDLVDLIRDTGFRPVECDAHYAVVREHEGPDPARRDAPQPMRV